MPFQIRPYEEIEVARNALMLHVRAWRHVVLSVDQLVAQSVVFGEQHQQVVVGELHAGRLHGIFSGHAAHSTVVALPSACRKRQRMICARFGETGSRIGQILPGRHREDVAEFAGPMSEPLIRDITDTARWVAYYRAQETDRPDAVFRDPYARALAGERDRPERGAAGVSDGGCGPRARARPRRPTVVPPLGRGHRIAGTAADVEAAHRRARCPGGRAVSVRAAGGTAVFRIVRMEADR